MLLIFSFGNRLFSSCFFACSMIFLLKARHCLWTTEGNGNCTQKWAYLFICPPVSVRNWVDLVRWTGGRFCFCHSYLQWLHSLLIPPGMSCYYFGLTGRSEMLRCFFVFCYFSLSPSFIPNFYSSLNTYPKVDVLAMFLLLPQQKAALERTLG